ncbi:MAG: EamA family transporter [Acidaminococcaceae bacterium]|nr:EamA family transporter [Acidaminococcaceae bacterium]
MKNSSVLSVLGAGILWGLIGLFVHILAGKGFDPLQITTLRVTAAMILTALIVGRRDVRQFAIRPRDSWMFFGNGVVGLVFFNYCYFNAIAGGSLAIAALLLYTAPAFVMLMSVALFHEKLTKEKAVALIMTFIGCGCITGAFAGNLFVSRQTLLYGLASGFGYALYSIFGKPATQKYSPVTVSLWCFIFAASFTLPFSGLTDKLNLFADWQVWGGILGISLISCVLPNVLYMNGLQKLEAGHAAILATVEPVVAAIVSFLFLGEAFSLQKLLGIVLILAAVPVLSRTANKK